MSRLWGLKQSLCNQQQPATKQQRLLLAPEHNVGSSSVVICSDFVQFIMSSGIGVKGTIGRCYPFYADLRKCVVSSAFDDLVCRRHHWAASENANRFEFKLFTFHSSLM